MSQYKHLSFDERKTIEDLLNQKVSFSKISKRIHRDRNSVAREVQRNFTVKRTGAVGQAFNNCKNRQDCGHTRLCKLPDCHKTICKGCPVCFRLCPDFEQEICPKLSLVPYVCNGCGSRHKCTLEKFVYSAKEAHKAYQETLVSSRTGIATPLDELFRLDEIISPLLKQGQSVHAILASHKDEIMLDEKTLYTYIKAGFFSAKPLDLLNMVKLRPRKKKQEIKVERGCKEGRSYRDFLAFMQTNPDTPIVQMDSIIGIVSALEPVVLTIHFVEAQLMLAFKRPANTAKSVTEIINALYALLGRETFKKLFPIILCDNGSEFSSPSAIEKDKDSVARTKLFYTDPGAPYQKGACENNHSLIRRVLPKGTSFKPYSQQDFQLLMNHINSYPRKKLNDRSPIEVFSFLHPDLSLEMLGINPICRDDVILNPSLLKK
jgi:IS30 family transposase